MEHTQPRANLINVAPVGYGALASPAPLCPEEARRILQCSAAHPLVAHLTRSADQPLVSLVYISAISHRLVVHLSG